ncbi:MAG: hypothetical protein K0B84_05440 [Firmicutes bacterium]|nr:hypothetical protein [Bacillota bacterium]
MQGSVTTVENNGNMIIKMIRRINASTIHFVMSIRFRAIGATILGGFAGLSLTTTVIPSALLAVLGMDNFLSRWGLGGFAIYSMMAWAVGGWAAQRTGNKMFGAIILGLVGLLTGLLFTGVGIGMEMDLLLTGGGAGLLYGAIGGLILTDALRNPYVDENDPEAASRGTIGGLGLFRYFHK